MSYAAKVEDLSRRAAFFVDRILKRAKPAELPFEQPTTFELVINMKTARALGLVLPPTPPRPSRRRDRISSGFRAVASLCASYRLSFRADAAELRAAPASALASVCPKAVAPLAAKSCREQMQQINPCLQS